ncbi:sulfopyruvate decarboxylase alpha subunit [Tamaricihabitans halophyticus]|uniref:Sulfopyruvate decarboxylase alpha subunit n=1 Tax=Tamaricihabitans halophyticus TaxID=1262583 RepID=A0A4R2PTW0_9PSEU|nr:thiamine pyrophosphate-binding protein [Tamaricihabitans halophyticus]TCP39370.1 sulfopyruvate decarboxylase alpha subunit [Tamaricihabitans halophyticus]
MTTSTPTILQWQAEVVDQLLAADVSVAAFVPDSRLNGVLTALSGRGVPLRSLTREEECVAYAAGARIAGKRAVVMLQSSGIGNALNALGTLAVPYRLGIPMIVSMRGTLGETNPSQIPIGRATSPMLGSLGIQSFSLRSADDAASMTEAVLNMAYQAGETSAVLLEPELGGQRERR